MIFKDFKNIKIENSLGVSPSGKDTQFFAKHANKLNFKSALDVGTGTGFIPIYLVKNGYAWCYEYYNHREKIKNAETIAKKEKIGLWAKENFKPISPWKWRKNKKLKNE